MADGLATEADMVAYLQAALEDGAPALLTAAFDDVERARAALRGQPSYTLEELLVTVVNGGKRLKYGELFHECPVIHN